MLGLRRPRTLRWTDDTEMALILAESLGAQGRVNPDDLATRWARAARWHRGYGKGTLRVLRRIRRGESWETAAAKAFPGGSWGNGGAMRVAPIALAFPDPAARDAAATLSCQITHAHPLAIEGARLVAAAIGHVLEDPSCSVPLNLTSEVSEYEQRLAQRLTLSPDASPREVAQTLGNDMSALGSCVTALHLFERFADAPFHDLISFACALRGDTDTIGALAGAMYGARRGATALPQSDLDRLEACPRITSAARGLQRFG